MVQSIKSHDELFQWVKSRWEKCQWVKSKAMVLEVEGMGKASR